MPANLRCDAIAREGPSIGEEGPRLRRALTLLDIFMLGITGMIGSAWLFSALGAVGVMGPAAILSWVLAGVLFMVMTFSFAELGGLFPFSGSLARYNHYTHGIVSNYLLAWAYFIGALTTVTTEAEAIVEYASSYAPALWNSSQGVLTPLGVAVAAAIILALFAIQLVGVHVFGWFNRVVTAWKLIVPTLTFVLLMLLYFKPRNLVSAPGGFFPYGTSVVFSGMVVTGIVYAYEGFRQGLEYAGEARNPQRDVPLGTMLALAVTIAIYVLLQVAFIGGINWSKAYVNVTTSDGWKLVPVQFGNWTALSMSTWASHPFYSELVATGVPLLVAFSVILLIDAAFSPLGTLAAYVGTSARNMYGMSRVGYIPRFFSSIHERFRTPWIALIVSTALAVAFLAPFPTWYEIMTLSAVATVYNYLAAGITNHALRRLSPGLKRPYRPPAWYVVYPASFVVAALMIYWSGWSYVNPLVVLVVAGLPLLLLGPYRSKIGLGSGEAAAIASAVWASLAASVAAYYMRLASWGLSGFAIYWAAITAIQAGSLAYLHYRTRSPDVRAAWWLVAFNAVVGVISYIGSLGPMSSPLLPYPWDYVAMTAASLGVYFLGVYTAYKTDDLRDFEAHGIRPE